MLGKAYETFLAGVRHEEGVYYTPKYITQSIVENTVGEDLDALISQIEREVLDEARARLYGLTEEFLKLLYSVHVALSCCLAGYSL